MLGGVDRHGVVLERDGDPQLREVHVDHVAVDHQLVLALPRRRHLASQPPAQGRADAPAVVVRLREFAGNLLPEAKGRTYYECDIDTAGKNSRGPKRIVFSNDGLIFYTDDHYESFTLLYGEDQL